MSLRPSNPGRKDNDPDGTGAGFFTKQANLLKLRRECDKIVAEAARAGLRFSLSEALIQRLHLICMIDLLSDAGRYRETEVTLTNKPHVFPSHAEVPRLMQDFCALVANEWDKKDLVWLSALCLWRLNWIHPFRNGNGRTAREVSYLVLSIKFGDILPKKNSIIEQIMAQKPLFEQVLGACDATFAQTSNIDAAVRPMGEFLAELLKRQLTANLT